MEEVQDVCSVFISVEKNQLRFSHLTVQEYLESRAAKDDRVYGTAVTHNAIALACLAGLTFMHPVEADKQSVKVGTAAEGEHSSRLAQRS